MFKDKVSKKLAATLDKYGLTEPRELQRLCFPKINSGADLMAEGPEDSGKSTLISLALVHKLQYAIEEAPRALVLVASKDKALAMKTQFDQLAEETDLRSVAVFEEGKLELQNESIYTGTDLVIGTPRRMLELYISRNLNLNRIKWFVLDDAELLVKSAWQGQIDRLGVSLPKCQHLLFGTDLNEKVHKLVHKIMVAPQEVSVGEQY